MIIAIDYDDTFTADPQLWRHVIGCIESSGHRVVCVSARLNSRGNQRELGAALPSSVEIFLSYDKPKRQYMQSKGVEVDIWIDDMPEAIPTVEDVTRMNL